MAGYTLLKQGDMAAHASGYGSDYVCIKAIRGFLLGMTETQFAQPKGRLL